MSQEQEPTKLMFVMTESLIGFRENMNQQQESQLVQNLVFYIQQYKGMQAHYGRVNTAASFHMYIDDEITDMGTEFQGRKVICKQGCAFCCQQHVAITDDEAELLIFHCKENGIEIDWDMLERQSSYNDDKSWKELEKKDMWCQFLDKETMSCKVYEHRPGVCRTLRSVDDSAEKCDVNTNPNGMVMRYASIKSEIIQSAVMTATKCDSMAVMLLKAKNLLDSSPNQPDNDEGKRSD